MAEQITIARRILRRALPARFRYGFIRKFERLNIYYAKGIAVLSFIRNIQVSDAAILVGVTKYLFGEQISNWWLIGIAIGYWVINTLVNTAVGWFWEHHRGWQIAAQERASRIEPTRTVLVDGQGEVYGPEEIGKEAAKHLHAIRVYEEKKRRKEMKNEKGE